MNPFSDRRVERDPFFLFFFSLFFFQKVGSQVVVCSVSVFRLFGTNKSQDPSTS